MNSSRIEGVFYYSAGPILLCMEYRYSIPHRVPCLMWVGGSIFDFPDFLSRKTENYMVNIVSEPTLPPCSAKTGPFSTLVDAKENSFQRGLQNSTRRTSNPPPGSH